MGVENTNRLRARERVARNLQVTRNFETARVLSSGAVRHDFHPLAFDSIRAIDPDAFAVAVAGAGIASIGVGLLQSPIRIENVHVIRKGCSGILNEPCAHHRMGCVVGALRMAPEQPYIKASDSTTATDCRTWRGCRVSLGMRIASSNRWNSKPRAGPLQCANDGVGGPPLCSE